MQSRRSTANSELTSAINGKHLICLRDLTKNRGDSGVVASGDLSPPDIKYVPPAAPAATLPTVSIKTSPGASTGNCRRLSPSVDRRSNSNSPTKEPSAADSPSPDRRSNGSAAAVEGPPSSPGEVRSPDSAAAVSSTLAAATTTTTTTSSAGEPTTAGAGGTATAQQGQLNKLKRFLGTVQQFADDIAPDIGDRVRTLVLALVNSQLCAEEFHRRLQEATNFPLRPFVVPFLKANLPLLQQELTSNNNNNNSGRVTPPSPTDADRRSAALHWAAYRKGGDDTALTPAAAAAAVAAGGLADARQRLWYLGGLMPGVLLPRHGATAAPPPPQLDLNANGKRTLDRLSDSPIDLKLDLFNPTIKRLHIDIPSRPPPPPPPSFDAHQSLPLAAFSGRSADDSGPGTTAVAPRDLSVSEPREHSLRNGPPSSGDTATAASAAAPGNTVNSATVFGLRRSEAHFNHSDVEDDWQGIDNILQSIVAMVDRCRRTMVVLKEQCRRDRAAATAAALHGPSPGSAAAADRLSGAFNRGAASPNGATRGVDDLQVLQVRQLAEEAVNEVKRQAVAELHRAVAAAEVKATVAVTAERARLEKVVNEVRAQARHEAFALLNSQEDSTENCWNCGRKAYETCSGCHRARYCGTFCQHRHWETHHLTCKLNQPTSSTSTASSSSSSSSSAAALSRSSPARDAGKPTAAAAVTTTGGEQRRSPRRENSRAAVTSAADTPAIDFSASGTVLSRHRRSVSPVAAAVAVAAAAASRPGSATADMPAKLTAVV